MNRFDGLSLPQLLDLLHEIVLPDPVALWPQTQGWWTALGWLLAVTAIGVSQWVAFRRRNRYRREAEAELTTIAARADSAPSDAAAQIAALLKRTALVAFPRKRIASLYGRDWADFLRESANNDPLVDESADRIAGASWRPDADARALVEPARRWIRKHRV